MRCLVARHRVTDILPPQLCQLGVVGDVGAGGRPLQTGGRAVELDQPAQFGRAFGEVRAVEGGLTNEGQANVGLFHVHRFGGDELGVEPGRLSTVHRGGLHQGPGPHILIADLCTFRPVGAVRRGGHAPFRRAVLVHHRRAGFDRRSSEGGVPEHLLGNFALGRNWPSFRERHAHRGGWCILLQPLDRLGHRIDSSCVVRRTATRDAGTDWLGLFVHTNAPFVHRQAVRLTLVAHAGHRHPRVGVAPAERGVLLAVVHVAPDRGRPAHVGHVSPGEELGDILIG